RGPQDRCAEPGEGTHGVEDDVAVGEGGAHGVGVGGVEAHRLGGGADLTGDEAGAVLVEVGDEDSCGGLEARQGADGVAAHSAGTADNKDGEFEVRGCHFVISSVRGVGSDSAVVRVPIAAYVAGSRRRRPRARTAPASAASRRVTGSALTTGLSTPVRSG